eukprot:TRINITY_DN2171_c0_g1_i2.p2 TRINITY_DN2171_c0_g1~~TRINITY_DN2171_c0_g1_i2.p2  ORF type:complete len:103 (+),score=5.98 TRINITY_DN2171_c0_g1_i2:788-1096(+)
MEGGTALTHCEVPNGATANVRMRTARRAHNTSSLQCTCHADTLPLHVTDHNWHKMASTSKYLFFECAYELTTSMVLYLIDAVIKRLTNKRQSSGKLTHAGFT